MKLRIGTLLLAAFAATASAQVGEISVSAGSSNFRNSEVNTINLATGSTLAPSSEIDSDFRLGFRLTINSYKFFGHEFGYAYSHGKLKQPTIETGMPIHQGFYDFLVYGTPEGARVRPFACGGGGFSSFYPAGTSVYSGNGSTKFGFNYGGGVKVRMTPILGFRLDVRDYTNGRPKLYGLDVDQPSGLMHQLELSAGVSFLF